MLTPEERRQVEEQTKDVWQRQLFIMVAPLFSSRKIGYEILTKKRIVFKDCVLKRDIDGTAFKKGDFLERIAMVFSDDGWHTKLYRTKADRKNPVELWFYAQFGGPCVPPVPQ